MAAKDIFDFDESSDDSDCERLVINLPTIDDSDSDVNEDNLSDSSQAMHASTSRKPDPCRLPESSTSRKPDPHTLPELTTAKSYYEFCRFQEPSRNIASYRLPQVRVLSQEKSNRLSGVLTSIQPRLPMFKQEHKSKRSDSYRLDKFSTAGKSNSHKLQKSSTAKSHKLQESSTARTSNSDKLQESSTAKKSNQESPTARKSNSHKLQESSTTRKSNFHRLKESSMPRDIDSYVLQEYPEVSKSDINRHQQFSTSLKSGIKGLHGSNDVPIQLYDANNNSAEVLTNYQETNGDNAENVVNNHQNCKDKVLCQDYPRYNYIVSDLKAKFKVSRSMQGNESNAFTKSRVDPFQDKKAKTPLNVCYSADNKASPVALRMVKTLQSFDHSECKRVKPSEKADSENTSTAVNQPQLAEGEASAALMNSPSSAPLMSSFSAPSSAAVRPSSPAPIKKRTNDLYTCRKPPYTYAAMAIIAIQNSENKILRFDEIVDALKSMFLSYFNGAYKRWQRSLRAALNSSKCFVKEKSHGKLGYRVVLSQVTMFQFRRQCVSHVKKSHMLYLHDELNIPPIQLQEKQNSDETLPDSTSADNCSAQQEQSRISGVETEVLSSDIGQKETETNPCHGTGDKSDDRSLSQYADNYEGKLPKLDKLKCVLDKTLGQSEKISAACSGKHELISNIPVSNQNKDSHRKSIGRTSSDLKKVLHSKESRDYCVENMGKCHDNFEFDKYQTQGINEVDSDVTRVKTEQPDTTFNRNISPGLKEKENDNHLHMEDERNSKGWTMKDFTSLNSKPQSLHSMSTVVTDSVDFLGARINVKPPFKANFSQLDDDYLKIPSPEDLSKLVPQGDLLDSPVTSPIAFDVYEDREGLDRASTDTEIPSSHCSSESSRNVPVKDNYTHGAFPKKRKREDSSSDINNKRPCIENTPLSYLENVNRQLPDINRSYPLYNGTNESFHRNFSPQAGPYTNSRMVPPYWFPPPSMSAYHPQVNPYLQAPTNTPSSNYQSTENLRLLFPFGYPWLPQLQSNDSLQLPYDFQKLFRDLEGTGHQQPGHDAPKWYKPPSEDSLKPSDDSRKWYKPPSEIPLNLTAKLEDSTYL